MTFKILSFIYDLDFKGHIKKTLQLPKLKARKTGLAIDKDQ